ncbi:MAG: diguanylate cyclase, partial [Clostridia bacterium]
IEHIKSSYGKITMSIGYASVKDTSAKTYVELISYADEALYFSKNNGKSRATPYSEVILDKTKKEEETKDPVAMTKV